MNAQKKQRAKNGAIQFVKFGLVGFVNTILYYLVYLLCLWFDLPYAVGHYLGFFISATGAWALNSRFVFKESQTGKKRVWWQVLLKTYVSYGVTGLVLNRLLLLLWIDILHIGQYLGGAADLFNQIFGGAMTGEDLAEYVAPLFNLLIGVPLNFFINKCWAYRQKKIVRETDPFVREEGPDDRNG